MGFENLHLLAFRQNVSATFEVRNINGKLKKGENSLIFLFHILWED